MQEDTLNQVGEINSKVDFDTFQPVGSGNYSRLLNRGQIRPDQSDPIAQTMGIKEPQVVDNINKKFFNSISEFEQPPIVGFGYVTSAGAKDTTYFFMPQAWTVSRTGAGVYLITHNIGTVSYFINTTAIDTVAKIITVANITTTTFEVRTFTDAGVAADTAFSFVVNSLN